MRFDEALPAFVKLAVEHFGREVTERSLFLRDAHGRLTLVLRDQLTSELRASFDEAASQSLRSYVSGASATPAELFDDSLKLDVGSIAEQVSVNRADISVKLLDRQIIGQDWNNPNFEKIDDNVPVLTFYSCKGGVGRTTALSVLASELSSRGKNVCIIDLDLEAPGLGSILLRDEDLPESGLIDFLIENRMDGVSDLELESYIAPSPLTSGRGLIEVFPAVGAASRRRPDGVIPKLGRAYLEGQNADGEPTSFSAQVRDLLRRVIDRRRTDVVLVDARAGLSEVTAPALLGLGGELLFFGIATPQTIECYRFLLGHLARLARADPSNANWRYQMRMVHAKSGRGEAAWEPFRNACYNLFSETLYEEQEGIDLDVFNFDVDDPDGPHFPWPIPFDAEFSEFDPSGKSSHLSRDFYEQTFGPFLKYSIDLLFPQEYLDD